LSYGQGAFANFNINYLRKLKGAFFIVFILFFIGISAKVPNHSAITKDEVLEIIINQLDDYLDNSYQFEQTSIKYIKAPKKMVKDMNQIVLDTLNPYQDYVLKDFDGFSENVLDKIETLAKVNWNSNKTGNVMVDAGEVGKDYVRSKIKEIKSLVKSEIEVYSSRYLEEFGQPLPDEFKTSDPDTSDVEFNPSAPLIPINEELRAMPISDIPFVILDIETSSNPGDNANLQLNDEVMQKMLALMASNNQLIEKISEEMSLMRVSLEEMRREGEERDKAIYQDLNAKYLALKDAIVALQKEGNPDLNFANTRPIPNKGNVEIKFSYGSVFLSGLNKVVLNSVFADMLRNPTYKLIITGYADRSGNKEQNILLSQKRADAVKFHLNKMGISKNRMVVNYLGDAGSENNNPDDRKVVIEWLEEVDVFGN